MKKNCELCSGTGNTRTDNVGYCRCKRCDGKGWYADRIIFKALWKSKGLDCRMSITPAYAVEVCDACDITFDESLIYTNERYREQSNGKPRVDCKDLLIFLCGKLSIFPDKEHLEFSNKMSGEGSRRDIVEEAYLGR